MNFEGNKAKVKLRKLRYPLWFEVVVLILTTIMILNLNGVFVVVLDITRALSWSILLLCGVAIWNLRQHANNCLASSGKLLISFFGAYILWGGLIGILRGDIATGRISEEAVSFSASIIIIFTFSLIGYSVKKNRKENRLYIAIYLLFLLATSSGFIGFIFPVWNEIFVTKVLAVNRITGFFANPNELGIQVGYLLSFGALLTYSRRSLWWITSALGIGLPIAILTQSKSSVLLILILLFTLLIPLIKKSSATKKFIIFSMGTGCVIFILALVSGSFSTQLDLSSEQERRSSHLRDLIFERELSDEIFTGRLTAFEVGFETALAAPITGNGLSALTRMPKIGLGCHNTPLKIFGDAGIFMLVFFLVACFFFIYSILRECILYKKVCFICCVLTMGAACATGHDFLDQRNHNLIVGLLIGLTSTNTRNRNVRHLKAVRNTKARKGLN